MRRDARGRLVLGGARPASAPPSCGCAATVAATAPSARGGLFAGRLPRTRIAALALRRDGAVVFTGTARVDGRDHLAVARLRGR